MNISLDRFKTYGKHVLLRRDDPDIAKGQIIIPEQYRKHGWAATVLQMGHKITNFAIGDRVFYLREYTIAPFEDRSLAITDGNNIVARLCVFENRELIIPINNYLLIKPDAKKDRDGIIFRPDQAIKAVYGGEVVCCGEKCETIQKFGTRVYYHHNTALVCVECGKTRHLMREDEIFCIEEK